MRSNYKFRTGIWLVFGNHELDLHNDYDFVGVHHAPKDQIVTLSWLRSKREWVKQDIPEALDIVFSSVSSFEFRPRNSEKPFTEDDCLNNAGFITDEEWGKGLFMIPDGEVDPKWKHAFEFMSGAVVAIQADESKVVVKS